MFAFSVIEEQVFLSLFLYLMASIDVQLQLVQVHIGQLHLKYRKKNGFANQCLHNC